MVLDGEFSDSVSVLSGVSQGSVLGPVNDLPDSLSSNVRLFADETIVYLTIHSDAGSQVLQKDPDKLANWEMLWKMKFNPGKCEVLRVGRTQTRFNLSRLHTPQ